MKIPPLLLTAIFASLAIPVARAAVAYGTPNPEGFEHFLPHSGIKGEPFIPTADPKVSFWLDLPQTTITEGSFATIHSGYTMSEWIGGSGYGYQLTDTLNGYWGVTVNGETRTSNPIGFGSPQSATYSERFLQEGVALIENRGEAYLTNLRWTHFTLPPGAETDTFSFDPANGGTPPGIVLQIVNDVPDLFADFFNTSTGLQTLYSPLSEGDIFSYKLYARDAGVLDDLSFTLEGLGGVRTAAVSGATRYADWLASSRTNIQSSRLLKKSATHGWSGSSGEHARTTTHSKRIREFDKRRDTDREGSSDSVD